MIGHIAARLDEAELAWKAANGGDDVSIVDMPTDLRVRAMLEALRNPPAGVVNAGKDAIWKDRTPPNYMTKSKRQRVAFNAMIDAMLEGA